MCVLLFSSREKLGEYRRNLQQGLEVIRGVGSHGMEVQLVIHLAHTFSSKADALEKVFKRQLIFSAFRYFFCMHIQGF